MGLIANPVIPDALCTLKTCSLLQAHVQYLPSVPANAAYLAIFAIILMGQIGLGVRYRTWGFLGGMVGGLILEVLGYMARILMHNNPFTDPPFLMYLVVLTIGPAFLTASIYLCLARIVVVYGAQNSRFRPRTYTITFMTCDFISLLLQAAGGAIASGAKTNTSEQSGIHIMVAGLSFQVASLAAFAVLSAEFAWRVRNSGRYNNERFFALTSSFKFKAFLLSLAAATLTIFIRSCFRVAELSQGFHGKLANSQITFMILEGAMIIIATTLLTLFHPGIAFAGNWAAAGWSLRKSKAAGHEVAKELGEVEESKDGSLAGATRV